jgi:hypothetical protein
MLGAFSRFILLIETPASPDLAIEYLLIKRDGTLQVRHNERQMIDSFDFHVSPPFNDSLAIMLLLCPSTHIPLNLHSSRSLIRQPFPIRRITSPGSFVRLDRK